MDYAAFIELVGFDIIFLGLLTLLTCYIARELWRKGWPSKTFEAIACGWRDYKNYLQGCLGSSEEQKTTARAAQLIGMLLMASLLGMVINIMADRLLDNDAVRYIPVVWPKYNEKEGKYNLWPCETWHPEDAIKYDALKSSLKLYTDKESSKLRALHKIEDPQNGGCDDWQSDLYQKGEEHVKELFQRAYSLTLSEENKPVAAMLRYEYLAVKILRTLLGISIILLLAALCGLSRKIILRRLGIEEEIHSELTHPSPIKATIALVLLFSLPLLFLGLWSTQSKRYDKKLFHAYFMLAKDKDKEVMWGTPEPSLSPSTSATSETVKK